MEGVTSKMSVRCYGDHPILMPCPDASWCQRPSSHLPFFPLPSSTPSSKYHHCFVCPPTSSSSSSAHTTATVARTTTTRSWLQPHRRVVRPPPVVTPFPILQTLHCLALPPIPPCSFAFKKCGFFMCITIFLLH
jgi:hypothetical protein